MEKVIYAFLAIIIGSVNIHTAETMKRPSSDAGVSETEYVQHPLQKIAKIQAAVSSSSKRNSPHPMILTPTMFAQNLYRELYRKDQTSLKPLTNYIEQQGWRLMTPPEIHFLKNATHPWVKFGTKCYPFGVIDTVGAEMLNAWMLIPELKCKEPFFSPLLTTLDNTRKSILKLLESGIPYDLISQHYKKVQDIVLELPPELRESAFTEIWSLFLQSVPLELLQQEYTNVKLFVSALPQSQQAQAATEIWSLLLNQIPFQQILQEYVRVNETISKLSPETEDVKTQHYLAFAEFWTLLHYGIPFQLAAQEYANVRKFISDLRLSYLKSVHEPIFYSTVTDIWKLLRDETPLDLIKQEYFKVQEFSIGLLTVTKRNAAIQLVWHFLRNKIPFERAIELYTQIHNTAAIISKDNPYRFYTILAHSIAPNEAQLRGQIIWDEMCWTFQPDGAITLICDGTAENMQLVNTISQQGVNITELEIQNATMTPFPNEVITSLCEAIRSENCKLKILNLSNCSINNSQVQKLAGALKHNSSILTLNLGGNTIKQAGLKYLAVTLKSNRTLTHLYLNVNDIPDTCESTVTNLWKNHPALTYLNLQGNWISPETKQKLEKSKPTSLELSNIISYFA